MPSAKLLVRPRPGEYNVRVSEEQRSRALALMHILASVCRRRQWKLENVIGPVETFIYVKQSMFDVKILERVVDGKPSGHLHSIVRTVDTIRVRTFLMDPPERALLKMIAYIEGIAGARSVDESAFIGECLAPYGPKPRAEAWREALRQLREERTRNLRWRAAVIAEDREARKSLAIEAQLRGWVAVEYDDWNQLRADMAEGKMECILENREGVRWVAPLGELPFSLCFPHRPMYRHRPPLGIVESAESARAVLQRLTQKLNRPPRGRELVEALCKEGLAEGSLHGILRRLELLRVTR